MIAISHGTRVDRIRPTNGYGYATVGMTKSLHRLGYDFRQNNPEAPVELWFDQPHHWNWREHQYKIGYHPWESTEIDPDWLQAMRKCDEVWSPSPIIADWYREWGLKNVYTYEHGVDPIWTIQHRKVVDKIRFLHVGGEALRKGGDLTLDAFRAAFQGVRDDVELTLKMISDGWAVPRIGKVNVVNNTLTEQELVSLFHNHHVFVYPSWGEGFGLNPLQAMATGMPTICTGAWAPYGRLLDPDLTVDSERVPSPWPNIHPGEMFKPNLDDLVDRMRHVADNYEDCLFDALPRAFAVKEEYDWDYQTAKAFSALEWRLFEAGKISKINGL